MNTNHLVTAIETAFQNNIPQFGSLQVVITYHDGKPAKVEYSRTETLRGAVQEVQK